MTQMVGTGSGSASAALRRMHAWSPRHRSRSTEHQTFYDGWANYHHLLLDAIRDLSADQLRLRPAPGLWAVWQLAGHMAATRTYWFHDVLGEGDPALRDLFRVQSTTVPGLAVEDATWEDDEDHPRGPAEIVEGLERSWAMIDDCLRRWTPDDLAVGSLAGGLRAPRRSPGGSSGT